MLAKNLVTDSEEHGLISGYASLFNIADLSNDVVEKGAFQNSLKSQYLRKIQLLFQHDPDQPIGSWHKIVEDKKGLYVEGKLTLNNARAKDIHALIVAGAIEGLSIGFKTKRSRKNPKTGARHIIEAELWEISIVTFPMLPSARIDHVKSAIIPFSKFDTQIAQLIRKASEKLKN
ncbi:MAG: HK97 family phage prohead protease [Rhizobiaceae bacterium]|nr:HK97 family phage prohead protease [Rhizobiaceae bacterium]